MSEVAEANRNAVMVPPPVKTALAAYDFQPTTLAEAMELAKMLAESTMVPKDYLNKPGNCFIAMQYGHELGLKPVQALQSIAVINGKPGIYGDAGKALLIANGCEIIERDTRETREKLEAECTIVRQGRRPVTRTFSVDDAKTARLWDKDGPWKQYPYRQLAWRAFWFAARDAAADILKGIPAAEELRDRPEERDVTGEGSDTIMPRARSEAAAPPAEGAAQNAGDGGAPSTQDGPRQQPETQRTPKSDPETTTASEGMLSHIRKRMETATLTEPECFKKFGLETLEGISVKKANDILHWIANPSE
jgi:hypothetical protein